MKIICRFLLLVLLGSAGINLLHAQWVQTNGPYGGSVISFAVSGTNIFAVTSGGGVFLSTNNDTNWTEVNSGLTNIGVFALAVSGTNLFAGTFGGGVWRRPLSEIITSVEGYLISLPRHFSLSQNYPNPFNPTTNFEFRIADRGLVSLKVYDILGNVIAAIVNEELPAGNYKYQWNASGLASGVYYYHLQGGDFVDTKKLILMK